MRLWDFGIFLGTLGTLGTLPNYVNYVNCVMSIFLLCHFWHFCQFLSAPRFVFRFSFVHCYRILSDFYPTSIRFFTCSFSSNLILFASFVLTCVSYSLISHPPVTYLSFTCQLPSIYVGILDFSPPIYLTTS